MRSTRPIYEDVETGHQAPPGYLDPQAPPGYGQQAPPGYGQGAANEPWGTRPGHVQRPPATAGPPPPEQAQEVTYTTSEDEDFSSAFASAFSEKKIRLGFIKKVFGILSVQLLITGACITPFMFVEAVRDYAVRNIWMLFASMALVIVLTIVMACCNNVRRKYPTNLICLLVFTLAMSWMLGTVVSRYSAREVLMAVGIVFVITLAMVCIGFQSKYDFTWMLGGLMNLTICLIMFGILCAIFRDRYLYIGLAAGGALLFSMWLLVDVQLLMGGKHAYAIDPEEYIFAALNLYMDIINLLLRILILIRAAS